MIFILISYDDELNDASTLSELLWVTHYWTCRWWEVCTTCIRAADRQFEHML